MTTIGRKTETSQSAVILRPTANTLLIEYYDNNETFQSRRIITRNVEMPAELFDAFVTVTRLKEVGKA